MDLSNSYFSGSSIINLNPCTSSEGRLCHIFRDVASWNKYFWQVDLELRELSPGQLSLVEKHEAYVGAYANNHDLSQQMRAVAALLHHLLTLHHCVSSVVILKSIFWDHHQLICDALCKSPSLTKLKLDALHMPSPRTVAAALLHLSHLRELEFEDVPFNRTFLDGLSEFLASTRSLETLTVTRHDFNCEEDAFAFVQALRRNQTLTTLSFDIALLSRDPLDRGAAGLATVLRHVSRLHLQ
ncbi:hypothetical protein MTO96_033136 [Rhipicephalus appendiculatus]